MVAPKIRGFIETRFRLQVGSAPLDDDAPLFSSGIVDSFGVLELIAFLEDAFGVEIDTSQHELAEFDTVRRMTSLVEHLQGSGAA